MSCYEWEKGEIVLPKGEWAPFRKVLIKDHNDQLMQTFELAVQTHAKVVEACKGTRGDNRVRVQREAWEKLSNSMPDSLRRDVYELIFKRPDSGAWERTELILPKKKDLGLLPLTSDCAINLQDASIYIRNDSHTVKWVVPENNRACEHARRHPTAQRLFTLLHQVKWIRGSGGTIVGNNEYNRDSDDEYGGGNYVVERYGPESAAEKRLKNMPYYWR